MCSWESPRLKFGLGPLNPYCLHGGRYLTGACRGGFGDWVFDIIRVMRSAKTTRRTMSVFTPPFPIILNPKTLNPKTLNPKTLNPKTLNPKTFNPKTLNPKPSDYVPKDRVCGALPQNLEPSKHRVLKPRNLNEKPKALNSG